MKDINKLKELESKRQGVFGMMAGSTHPRTGKLITAEKETLRLIELVNEYGEVIERLEAAEQRIAEQDAVIAQRNAERDRLIIVDRRDAAAGEPDYFIHRVEVCDSYGPDVELRAYRNSLDASKSKDDHGGEVIEVFTTAAQPAALPPEVTPAFMREVGEYELHVKMDTREAEYCAMSANWMRQQAIALGCKPFIVDSKSFERGLSVLNETLDDCGDSERGLLLALTKMGIEVADE